MQMKVICEKEISGVMRLLNITTATGIDVGAFLRTTPGVGMPFWCWPTIPGGRVVATDFTDAPIVTSDAATNNQLIAAITATPQEVLTYDPPL
ncbi:hypothetical protein [Shumkonia mesophila]|uniref:hypothetical protein n=1 Tax=Shumkonia mesophila TaxID=2838854 RepID=UPI0029353127|nr:hypothetical protein [Shumkonia mesophila]